VAAVLSTSGLILKRFIEASDKQRMSCH